MKSLRISALALAGATVVTAQAVTINFDVDAFSNNTFNGQSLNAAYGSLGLTFGADDQIFGDVTGTTTPPRGAIGASDFTSPLDITFDNVVSYVGATNMTNSAWELTVYDASWTALGSIQNTTWLGTAGVTAANIKHARFTGLGQYAIDDLTYEAVPEPGTMAALALGGAAMMRRRKKA